MPQQRIISLVPSITQLLHYLDLEQEVVGITKFCIHPKEWHQTKTRIGGTKNINLKKIEALHPTLIIANKEENVKEQIESLQQNYHVLLTDVNTLEEAYNMITEVGKLTNRIEKCTELVNLIQHQFKKLTNNIKAYTVAYCIWYQPIMVAANNTFINNILLQAGFKNVFSNQERYPTTSFEAISALKPDAVFLSSEPYPFKEKHIQLFKKNLPSQTKIIWVDGEMFSWYGSKLLETPQYLQSIQNQLINSLG